MPKATKKWKILAGSKYLRLPLEPSTELFPGKVPRF